MKEECLICKAPLEYLQEDVLMECSICHMSEFSKTRCVNGHYVCGGAKESCPAFAGKVGKCLHIGFDDPDAFTGPEEGVLEEFRRVRDEIRSEMSKMILNAHNKLEFEPAHIGASDTYPF